MDKLEHGDALGHGEQTVEDRGITRRSFVGYLIAAPTLVAAADLVLDHTAQAALPTVQPVDAFDLTDALTLTTVPTSQLISVEILGDGTVTFALPRAEVGQGLTTAVAMTIADEIGMPLDKVHVTLADARPELVWNQITAGSNSMHAIFTPVRVAAAIARERLIEAAAVFLGEPVGNLSLVDGVITSVTGQTVAVATVAGRAAVSRTVAVQPTLKSPSQFRLIGTPRGRVDAHDIVTGAKVFAMDLDIPGALPTMLCRAPTINASAISVRNVAAVKAMPGITDVVIIPHTTLVPGGVAVRGQTFGQCITAIRALDVVWGPGTVDGKSDATVLADLRASELPMLPPLLGKVIEDTFVFHFRPGDPLETNCAVADVRSDRAEVWAALKTPIWCKEQLALHLGLPLDKVTVHVTQAGGSFGRHLFPDAAFEAAEVSRVLGKPVKLMWHRTDNFRQGRVHPMCISHVRLVHLLGNVLTFDQRHTSVATDFSQGFGELLTAVVAMVPGLNGLGYAQLIFSLTANVPYNFGVVTQLINEIYAFNTFNTSSVRNIYSPEVCTAKELIVDRAARSMG
jgi:isoquinoline 1-oxidoreductase beta subunit